MTDRLLESAFKLHFGRFMQLKDANVKMYRKLKFEFINNIQALSYHSTKNNLNKYSDTVLLPKTKFPQKLVGKKSSEQNKYVYEKGRFADLYSWQQSHLPQPDFILHDGPPYANGLPHMGHAINKVLKDIINRYNVLRGKSVHYVPGWDCHGLPIELKAMSKAKKNDRTPLYIRTTARNFAAKTIEEQSKTFQSWGVLGDWSNPYLTYSVPYVKNQLKQFFKLYNKKLIYRDVKPVYWSPSSRTALAEAELEYNEKHKSTAVIARFKISQIADSLRRHLDTNSSIYALIWTTTPWTLPSNQAICYNPQLSYSFVKSSNDHQIYLIATDLITSLSKELQTELKLICNIAGNELDGVKYLYPFKSNVELPFLAGQHATATKGTGLVHTAPAHGPDDYVLALNYKIPVKCIVNETGCYTEEAELFKGLSVLKEGNAAVLEYLKDNILSIQDYIHSYPYDWRTKKPVILRASQQWFIDTNSIKDRAIELLQNVNIFPEKNSSVYKNSLVTQLRKRPYWCISRQRVWGVPIPVFYNKRTKEPIISESFIEHLCNLLDKNGTDFWWTLPKSDLFPSDLLTAYNLTSDDIEQGQDILDIWFDSGVSWSSVLGDEKIADVYLEGVDQFTGWFQSSLMTSVALRDKVPYKTIYVHGFAVDKNGHKMSKSLGNVVDPQEIIHGGKKQPALGIDTLRWWVACHASQNSTAFISSNVLQASADEIQKIRNTLRFAVGALADYSVNGKDSLSLKEIDKYLLHLLFEFDTQVSEMYNDYQFNRMCISVINFVTNPVSALYYSIIKDRLYCEAATAPNRRSAQFVLRLILNIVSKAIAPIVPHLVEELHMYRADKEHDTFFKSVQSTVEKEYCSQELARIMGIVLDIKRDLNKQVTNTLETNLEIAVSSTVFKDLQIFQTTNENEQSELVDIFQVSDANIRENEELSDAAFTLTVKKSKHTVCPRCKRYVSSCEGQLCVRCTIVVESMHKVAIFV